VLVEQAKQLGVIDTFAEGCEAGQAAGHRQLKIMGAIFVIACLIFGFFALMGR